MSGSVRSVGWMEAAGKWGCTSATHIVLAFEQAMKELEQEGGSRARHTRYQRSGYTGRKLRKTGISAVCRQDVAGTHSCHVLVSGRGKHFDFQDMYAYIKERGYAIYPGKLTDADTFRIGVIGEIYEEDILRLTEIMKSYMEQV